MNKINRYSARSPSRFQDISKYIESSDEFFIEFGCASGETLGEILNISPSKRVLGFDLEVNPNLGFKPYKCDMNNFDFNEHSTDLSQADVFLFLDVLEHLNEPWNFLNKLSTFMKIGSRIIISCPNFSSVRFLRAYLKGEMPLEEFGYFDRTHLRWFTPNSLIKSLYNKNFKASFSFLKSKKSHVRILQTLWPSRLCSQFTLFLTLKDNN
tara:strand:+ start:174 stop:803 length:630 start_codon:yes stop_codon:yes gene_type:complete